jgi:hypothetical protein
MKTLLKRQEECGGLNGLCQGSVKSSRYLFKTASTEVSSQHDHSPLRHIGIMRIGASETETFVPVSHLPAKLRPQTQIWNALDV